MAVWFRGPVNEEAVNRLEEEVRLTSPGGQETLQIGQLDDREVRGAFTNADGRTSRYIAFPAFDGGGIYEVTLGEDLVYSGTSTDGSTVEGQPDEKGNVTGTITTAEGKQIEFFTQNMALASAELLTEQGLPTTYTQFAENGRVPGEYVAVVAPGGSHWFGRSGNVRGGSPGANIIGLDKSH
jgi:bacillopeptidase F (M6 metalloprotease family)